MRSVFRNHDLFENNYFKKFPGFYVTGDGKSQNKIWEVLFHQHQQYDTQSTLLCKAMRGEK